MKLLLKFLITFLIATNICAREKGETEITTEDGIEVFQNDKFYLLKKNVKIRSDSFSLDADEVKIYFNDSLYDILSLDAKGNVRFDSSETGMKGRGEFLNYETQIENLKIEGVNSELITEDIEMYSDGFIEINNQNGKFFLRGFNSKLKNTNIFIQGGSIDGIFSNNKENKEIKFLKIIDENLSYVKNNDTEMYAKKIDFDYDTSLITMVDNVLIIRNSEKITGDFGTLDTKNNSYKIKSKNKTKVKAIIQNNEQ